SLGLKVRDHLADGLILIRQIDPNDLSPGQFAHSIRQQLEQEELKLVVFDGVSGYMNAMPEQRFLALHFHELLSYLARQGVVTLMVMGESSLVSTESASRIDLTTLADTVLLLRFATTGQGLQPLLCPIKHRCGPLERRPHELHFNAPGLSLGPARPEVQDLFQGLVRLPETLSGASNDSGP
ncbi:MAG: circadian clock protein KaiC, partial [Candidatus Competibacteraceae bacterium]|nr:circadian clock protein KaiC [Candidatus Competibacteraceae bacterium]